MKHTSDYENIFSLNLIQRQQYFLLPTLEGATLSGDMGHILLQAGYLLLFK